MKLLIRWAITAFALFVAAWLVPGITVDSGGWIIYAAMAVILGLVNAVVRPILKLLTCPLIVLTLGLFTLVINALTLWLSSLIAVRWFNLDFHVETFWAALLGSVIVSIVSVALSIFVKDDDEEERRRRPS
ncbi:MAG TPA: phage holin family protein [Anaerolineae bacterium]|nr:phage holin family protein [Anaerolineae bacterium]